MLNNKKRFLALALVLTMMLSVFVGCADKSDTAVTPSDSTAEPSNTDENKEDKNYKIAVVGGQANNPWYVRTGEGADQFAADTGYDVFQKCPSAADAAAQVQVVQDLISQNIDALVIMPISPESLEPVLKQAREQGIIVIAHEGATLQNIDYDLEAFEAHEYGAFIMDKLAEQMNYEGKYVTMVSFLTASSHNEWADAAIARQKEAYPNMELIPEEKLESEENQEVAYNRTKEILKKYPDLKGILGTTSFDPPGAQKAINELGLTGKVFTCGTGTTSVARNYIEDGSMACFTCWDPAMSVYACCNLAVKMLEGETIEDGIDLGLEGYDNMYFDETGKILQGAGWVTVDASNMDDYNF